jgi:YgiT-type zinc finger domain-containing protein
MKKSQKCPMCNTKLQTKSGTVVFPVKNKKISVKGLKYLECPTCHEKLFSHDAQQIIQAAFHPPKKRKVA